MKGLLNTSHPQIQSWAHLHGLPTDLPDKLVPVDANGVARAFFEEVNTKAALSKEHYPSVVCPWEAAWFDYRAPKSDLPTPGFEGMGIRAADAKPYIGIYVKRWEIPKSERETAIDNGLLWRVSSACVKQESTLSGLPPECIEAQRTFGTPRWIQAAFLFASGEERVTAPLCSYWMYVGETGEPFASASDDVPSLFYWPHDHRIQDAAMRYGIAPTMMMELAQAYVYPAYMTLSLLACKNVDIIDDYPPPKVLAKREKRFGPQIIYKVLTIRSMSKKTQHAEQGSCRIDANVGLHLRRGHWKDYREGNGLFGKYKDLFWWDDHVSGKESDHATNKEYAVL